MKNEAKEEQRKALVVEETSSVQDDQELPDDNGETDFINALQQLTLNNGLQYKRDDLINFHTSIKTNPLTVLVGMSGTGKSRLALNYAKMLGLSEDNNNLLFLPISPSYTEPSDVLGYLNSMNGLYVPSETGLVQFLRHASENPDQMHMVIFDEMNLSQVEYWFSPFISILEKDKGERVLTLYDEDAHCINEKVYPPHLKIGENVIFVGTVNLDDTTKKFSDRMLDRTFVINLAGESKNLEFKVQRPKDSRQYMKSIVAFTNGEGGRIIFGVDDKTHQVIGIPRDIVFSEMDAITAAISDSCEPLIIPDIYLQQIEDKAVIFVEISQGNTDCEKMRQMIRRFESSICIIQVSGIRNVL